MSDLKITELHLKGFKGRTYVLPLHGRDLVVAGNMIGKTSIVEGMEFIATGSISGVKREDLMSFCTDNYFSVGILAERDDGTTLKVTRSFRVTKSGGTKMVLKFEPEGLEENLSEAEDRLAQEFSEAPLVTFDLRAFLDGDDSNRLATCMKFAPGSEGGPESVSAEIRDLKIDGTSEESEALEQIRAEILGFTGPLPKDALERFQALTILLEKWAKTTRADVSQKTKSVRQIADLTREAGVTGGANIEMLTGALETAKQILRDLEDARAKAQERRELIKEERETLARRQAEELSAIAAKGDAEKAIDAAEESLSASRMALKGAESERDAWAESEAVRVKAAKETLKFRLQELDESRVEKKAAKTRLEDATMSLDEGRSVLRKLERQSDLAAQLLTILELDADPVSGSMPCPACDKALVDDERQALIARFKAAQESDDPASKQRMVVEGLEQGKAVAKAKFDQADEAELTARDVFEEAQKATHPIPFDTAFLDRSNKAVSRDEAYLERMHGNLKGVEAEVKAAKKNVADSEARIGDLSVELPAIIEDAAIEGGKLEVERIEVQIRTVEANRHRFEDAERIRKELAAEELRLKALKSWISAIGLKGLTGTWLSKTLGAVMGPAKSLVRSVIPGAELGLSWETPRGKPGLRIELRRENATSAYATMSGAERAIIGTALILSFAGVKRPPSILVFECEVMDRHTQEAYLKAVANLAGPSGLLITTHHGESDLGIYTRIGLTLEGPVIR